MQFPVVTQVLALYTLLTKDLPRPFQKPLRGGQKFEPPRLMPGINRGGRFLLTKKVTSNRLAKSIYGGS
jgi:hypothetical protein